MRSDDIRNRAWFEVLSEKLGTTQLTHAVARVESLEYRLDQLRQTVHEYLSYKSLDGKTERQTLREKLASLIEPNVQGETRRK